MPYWYMQVRSAVTVFHAVIGVFVFGYSYHRKQGFAWRILLSTLAASVIAYIFQHSFYMPGITPVAILTQASMSFICYLQVFAVCCFCLDESLWTVAFVTTAGISAQAAAGCIKSIVKLIPVMDRLARQDVGILLVDLLCYGGTFVCLFFAFRSFTRNREEIIGSKSKAIFTASVLLLYLSATWLSRDYTNGQSRNTVLVTNVYSVLLNVMIFTVQYGVLDRGRMTADLETMQELMHQQHVQYEASREGVQLINEKYHDLKNLIGSIENVLPKEELNRLRRSIERYDIQVHSGFEVLDVVLTEKMNLCLQRGIDMTCSLGQTDFGFLDEMDLYTLFNNALTNAINAVSSIPEGQERYILLSANQENNIITIHVENPCNGDIRFVDGIPQTSADPDWHGFGMKSMVRTAEKYGGALSASQENGCFQLDILLLNQTEPRQ